MNIKEIIVEATLDQIRQTLSTNKQKNEKERQQAQAQRAEQEAQRQAQNAEQEKQDAEQRAQEQEAKSRLRKIVQQAIVTGDRSEWDTLDPWDKMTALSDAGLIGSGDRYNYSRKADLSDQRLQQAILQRQQQQYDVEIGPEKRAELNAKAEELAEMRRQQLRAERVEDEKIAYERYKDKAEREDAMKKIEMQYQQELTVINTEHRNNMEAIRTGNAHEINKLDMEYAEAARERQHELDRDKLRQQQQQAQRPEAEPQFPEPEDEKDEEPGEPFRPQAPAGPALTAPAPTKPNKYNNDDVIDVDYKEEPPKPGKPPQLPRPTNEAVDLFNRIKQLVGR
jgi:hypothetical protein